MLKLPLLASVDDYYALWCYEPNRFLARVESIRGMDLASHMRAAQPRPHAPTLRVGNPDKPQVAIVPIIGTMMRGQSSFGGTSTVLVRQEIAALARDPQVSHILLQIQSPGGSVAGTPELADAVKAARKHKPVWAQIEDLGASAAYWVASQAGAIYANNSIAQVGSIGTIGTVEDSSGAAEKAGIKVHYFTTGPLKAAGAPGNPMTDEHRAYFQAQVDATQLLFDAAVKRGRALSDAKLARVKTGGVFLAGEALGMGLIDGVQGIDETVASLAKIK